MSEFAPGNDFEPGSMDELSKSLDVATVTRLSAAIALLVGGLVHFQLYFDGYRYIPDANLGRSFILNGVASVAVAAALVVRRDALLRLVGIGVAIGTLGAFALSRQGDGVFGLRETGLNPSPQALIALVAEIAAIAALAFSFLPKVGGGNDIDRRLSVPTAGIFVAVAIALCVMWNKDSDNAVTTSTEPGNVAISGFAFIDQQITVSAGSTITWTNADGPAHSVVAEDGSFISKSLGTGETFSNTFDTAGTYSYICGIHVSMTGTVVVSD